MAPENVAKPIPENKRREGSWTTVDFVILFFFGLIFGVIYYGLFFPDPYLMESHRTRLILLGLRILLPLAAIGKFWLYRSVRTGRVQIGSVVLLAGAFIIAGILAYAIGNVFYQRSIGKNLEAYHPYLQLAPHEFHRRGEPSDSAFVIMCLGGSTTEFADNAGRDWPSRVEELLRGSIPGRTVQVYNMARQWYTTQHSLINYELNLRQHKPDMIIVMQSINDLLHNADFSYFSHGTFRPDYGHFYGPVNRIIRRQSLAEYIVHFLGGLWYHHPRRIIDTDQFPGLVSYKNNLDALIDLARADSTTVVLMTEPSLFKDPITEEERAALYMLNQEAIGPEEQWSLRTAINGMAQYNEELRQIARRRGIPLIDLERAIPKSLDYFADEVHYTDKSFDVVARTVAGELKNLPLFH